MPEEVKTVEYEGTEYTEQEAAALATWLADPCFALLDRRFTQIRGESLDLMDSGMVGMENAEELVRNSAMRRLIFDVRTMKDALLELIEKDARIETS